MKLQKCRIRVAVAYYYSSFVLSGQNTIIVVLYQNPLTLW
jgi:hypothetical protein